MGLPTKTPPPAYRDNPAAEDLPLQPTSSSSAAVAPVDDAPSDLAVPPPYSDEETPQQFLIPTNNYYTPELDAGIKLSDGTNVVIGGFESEEPGWLEGDIRRWANVPPMKMVDILGTHTETVTRNKKTEQQTVTDFHFKLRLTEYLFTHPGKSSIMKLKTAENHDKVHRGTIFKKLGGRQGAADVEVTKPTLKEWCHRFHANASKLKMFALTREVSGLNEVQLTNKITSLVRSTNYKGTVCVTFPIENPAVQVWSNHWVNRWRHNMAICLVCYISMLWIFTWPALFFTTKKYTVAKAVWPFSVPDEMGTPQYATMSEAQWFRRWSQCIEKAIVNKVQGTLTEEDLARANEAGATLTPTGHAGIDTTLSFAAAGIQAYQEANRQLGWGWNT